MDYYSSVVILCILSLGSLGIFVKENGRMKGPQKRLMYKTYLVILFAILAEWGAVVLNGAPTSLIGLHALFKCIDYILSPMAALLLVLQIPLKSRDIHVLQGLLGVNAILQIVSLFTGWTYGIDEQNYYYHGPLHLLYIIFYMIMIFYCAAKFFVYGNRFRRKNRASMVAIAGIIIVSILLQEAVSSDNRTICLGMVIVAAFLFIHTSEFRQIENDDNMELQKKLLETDILTGLRSRYAYSEMIKELEKVPALPMDMKILSMDINGLKDTNDRFGHEAGDQLIKKAADCMKEVLAPYGTVYRTGGDEFIGILDQNAVSAALLFEQLKRRAMEKEISMSVGSVSVFEHPELPIEKLIVLADKRMYEDKKKYYDSLKK